DDVRWVHDRRELEDLAASIFRDLYHLSLEEHTPITLPHGRFPTLEPSVWLSLSKPVSETGIWKAVNMMGALKAQGKDGFQTIFFPKMLDGCQDGGLQEFFSSCQLHQGLNDTIISLIPKVKTPERIGQFCPISLCNVIYKVITKVLVLRMQTLLIDLIGPIQGSFILGRVITDNIVLAQEVVHSMRFKKGRKGWMVLKVELEKAYDSLRWDFIRQISVDSGFTISNDLGYYLGKLLARLSGWRIKQLRREDYLAKSVLSSLLVYYMAAMSLPRSTCEEANQIVKPFIWGSSPSGRRMHLVNWGEVCKEKKVGGLGVKNMTHLNNALLGKLSWRFLNQINSLWLRSFVKSMFGPRSLTRPTLPTSGKVLIRKSRMLLLREPSGLWGMVAVSVSGWPLGCWIRIFVRFQFCLFRRESRKAWSASSGTVFLVGSGSFLIPFFPVRSS
ncbi:LOW QUALITY PROTEIN: hypothetical protein V2J09_003625, partial [Rumex salicifolius]